MATERQPHLVQSWVKVSDARGRTRLEARWVLADDNAKKRSVAA